MKISARNQFTGKVSAIEIGAVNGIVTIEILGENITATISKNAIEELGLSIGSNATAIIKASEVLVATGNLSISARNKLNGVISSIEDGAVNAIVSIKVADDFIVSSTITRTAVKELGLTVGSPATAVIKATSVMIGC